MKKIIAILAAGTLFTGIAVTTASAEQYEVKKGDSLWKIAQKYDTTIQTLIDINNLDSTTIHPEQMITINETYIVEKGDTLNKIAKKFDVSVKEIKEWNNLTSHTIKVGQELKLFSSSPEGTNESDQADQQTTANHQKESDQKENVDVKQEEKVEVVANKKVNNSSESPEGKKLTVTATAYTAKCNGCSGITATGVDLNKNPNAKVIAVDPSVIPLGSKVYVEGYGHAIAADTGGAIKGNKIDLHVPTKDEAYNWGRRTVEVTVIGK